MWITVYTTSLALSLGLLLLKMSELSLESERLKTAQLELHRQKSLAQKLQDDELRDSVGDASLNSGDAQRLASLLAKMPVSREKLMMTIKNITRKLHIENPLITLHPAASTRLLNEQKIDIHPLQIEFIAPSDLLGYDLVELLRHQLDAVVVPHTLHLENISGTDSAHKIRQHISLYVLNFSNTE
jgi:hypothetical protein